MKTEIFEKDYVKVLDTSKRACSHQRWYRFLTVFNDYCVFVQTGKNNSKSFWDLSQGQPNF